MWIIKKVVKAGNYLYALVPDHPNCNVNGYVYMHRIVMENHLERILGDTEVVHHKNGYTHDNRFVNLAVMQNGEHTTHHGSVGKRFLMLLCPHCGIEFHREKRKTHVRGGSSSRATCCTRSCSTKFWGRIQREGVTDDIQQLINQNIIGEYILGAEDFHPFEYTGEPECFDDYQITYNMRVNPLLHKCPNCDNMCVTKYCSSECSHFALRRTMRPSKDELQRLLIDCTCDSLGELYGVSGTAVRKWCKGYGISSKKGSNLH